MAPGTFVEDMREPKGDRGFGTVVGITEDEIAVLWSSPPMALKRRLDPSRHNPLASAEDFTVSIITSSHTPQTPQQDAEDVEYFRKNLFAALKVPKEMLR